MKVLLDTCVWGGARIPLTEAGHDVVLAGDWSEDPGDVAILARAGAEGRVLVTLDKDFGEWQSCGALDTRASFGSLASLRATKRSSAFKSWRYTELCSKPEQS